MDWDLVGVWGIQGHDTGQGKDMGGMDTRNVPAMVGWLFVSRDYVYVSRLAVLGLHVGS
jgi:hypothetical protein